MPLSSARTRRGRARASDGPTLLALTLAAFALQGSPARAQSLPEASASALEHSFALRADRARQDGAEARLRGAVDAFMPSVAVTADQPLASRIGYSPQAAATRVGLEGPDTIPRRDPSAVGITASLPLFDGLKRWHTLQSARSLVESGKLLSIGKRQQVLLDTGIAYIAVLRDSRIVGYRESQAAAIRRIRDVTERQFEVNDATRTDVALTRSRVQEAEASRDRALADLAASRRDFIRLTRMEPERMVPPRVPDTLPPTEEAYAQLVRRANPAIAAGHLDAQSAAYQAKAIESELLPSVNLQISRTAQFGYSEAIKRIDDTTTRILARVPLYEPGTFPRIGEAAALARQRGYEAQDSELATVTAARSAYARRKVIASQFELAPV